MNVAVYKASLGASLPRKIAAAFERLLFVVVALSLVGSVFIYRAHWMPLLFSPIEHVQLHGQFIYIDRFEVEQLVRNSLGDHFFDTDLRALKYSLETLPWVKRTHVARVWPRTLSIEIEEHVAAARWGRDALLSTEGKVFAPAAINANNLAVLYASQSMELVALERYRQARALLETDTGVSPVALGEDRHGSWSLRLSNGLLIKVGDVQWESRLTRFAAAWRDGLAKQAERIRCVDLRYASGFAVAWKDRQESCT